MFYDFKESELDKYVYRIIPLNRLLELFSKKTNVMVKPEKWEDTFENFILKSKVRLKSGQIEEYNLHERVYGQCWTLEKASDAMWRIYSPNKDGIRIRTTIRALLESLYEKITILPETKCALGKVEYLSQEKLMEFANGVFDESGISVENIFRSLLVKRRAFRHEYEVRLLYDAWGENDHTSTLFSYRVDPQKLINQIMIDPRVSISNFRKIKERITEETGYKGPIRRSLLYTLPKNIVLSATDILDEDRGV